MSNENIPEWAQSLPEALHDSPHLKGSESAEQWVDHLKNDSAWRGQSIRVPSEGSDETVMGEFYEQLRGKVPGLMPTPVDDDAVGAVYGQLGKPDSADGYKVPEGIELDNLDEYRAAAHSLDMTQRVFNRWVEMESMGRSDQAASISEALESAYGALRQEWGAAYDDRYAKVGEVLRGAPESVIEAYNANRLPPDQVKWLHSLSELAAESTEVTGQQGASVMTPEQASMEIEEFKPTFYNMKKSDPGYAAAQAKMERLIRLRMGLAA